jgi:hypothetical protein
VITEQYEPKHPWRLVSSGKLCHAACQKFQMLQSNVPSPSPWQKSKLLFSILKMEATHATEIIRKFVSDYMASHLHLHRTLSHLPWRQMQHICKILADYIALHTREQNSVKVTTVDTQNLKKYSRWSDQISDKYYGENWKKEIIKNKL